MVFKVRKLHAQNEDFFPTETIECGSKLEAVQKYCDFYNFRHPVDIIHSVDDIYTAIDNSSNGNVIGKFDIWEVK